MKNFKQINVCKLLVLDSVQGIHRFIAIDHPARSLILETMTTYVIYRRSLSFLLLKFEPMISSFLRCSAMACDKIC